MEIKETNCLELNLGADVFVRDFSTSKEISSRAEKKIAIFGGGGIPSNSKYYERALELSKLISSSGISIITGGGPGIMEAGNRGALSAGAHSYGLRVNAIADENKSDITYFDHDGLFKFDTLSIRLLTLIGSSEAIVFFPGGYGTLEELFSLLVRIRVKMMNQIPIYLFGSEYWGGLVSWLNGEVLSSGAITKKNIDLFKVEDDIEKISQDIINHCLSLN